MGELKNFLSPRHNQTSRNYATRATDQKPMLTKLAKNFAHEYWDGSRETGYGGYIDDGRWEKIAAEFIKHYQLTNHSSILDFGCGKGFFLRALRRQLPGATLLGVDISAYAIALAPEEIREHLCLGSVDSFETKEKSFDLVVAMNTLHNLELPALTMALRNMARISRANCYLCVESYGDEIEKWNLLRWQLTCESFHRPAAWAWIFEQAGYRGDYEFIFFR